MSDWPLWGLADLRTRLTRSIAAARLHHALLLTGPAGVGKRTLALWIARGQLCSAGRGEGGCGSCGACHRVATGQHPDLHVVERPPDKTRIPVEAVRAILGQLERGALEGRGRLGVLLDVDTLNREGQNSLLKLLEEPPRRARLVLTCRRPEALLDTVRSRTERIAVPPLPAGELAALLAREHAIPVDEARQLASLADGSLGRARALFEAGSVARVTALCGPLLERAGSPSAWVQAVLADAGTSAGSARQDRNRRARETLRLAAALLRQRARSADAGAWDALELVLQGEEDLNLDLNAQLVLEDLFARMASRGSG